MHPTFGSIVGIIANTLVLLGAFCAYKDNFLMPSQMVKKGYSRGLPFIAHGGMWGDLVIVSPFAAVIVGTFSEEWKLRQIVAVSFISLATSIAMHVLYANGGFPSAHAHGKKLTAAGWIHMAYMAGAFAVFGLFYFFTPHVPAEFLITVSVLLGIHMLIGNNTVLRILKPSWWCNETLSQRMPGYVSVGLVWAFLAWRCCANIKAG